MDQQFQLMQERYHDHHNHTHTQTDRTQLIKVATTYLWKGNLSANFRVYIKVRTIHTVLICHNTQHTVTETAHTEQQTNTRTSKRGVLPHRVVM